MANPAHVEIAKKGTDAVQGWIDAHPREALDLRNARLPGLKLNGLRPNAITPTGVWNTPPFDASILANSFARLGLLLDGAHVPKAEFEDCLLIQSSFTKTNLEAASFSRTRLYGCDLSGASLAGAEFVNSAFDTCSLIRCDMTGALMDGAVLRSTTLDDSNLTGIELSLSDLLRVSARRSRWTAAALRDCSFGSVDFRGALDLDTCTHSGPSDLGWDTLLQEDACFPVQFLEGCGVPAAVIEYLPALAGAMSPIQYYSCFVSHSSRDADFAKRLFGRLREDGLRIWYAPEDIKGGRKTFDQIDEAIRIHDKLLLVLSENSIESEWVKTEVRRARAREIRERRQVLFPIRLIGMDAIKAWSAFDADTGKDLAVEVREYHIPDFSNWKTHDAFEAAFDRLLSDLKTSAEPRDGGPPSTPPTRSNLP